MPSEPVADLTSVDIDDRLSEFPSYHSNDRLSDVPSFDIDVEGLLDDNRLSDVHTEDVEGLLDDEYDRLSDI